MSLPGSSGLEFSACASASSWTLPAAGRGATGRIITAAVGVIIVNTTLLMSSAVTPEAALSYLNFGIRRRRACRWAT